MSMGMDFWKHGPRAGCTALILMLVGVFSPARESHADLIWRDHYSNNQSISNGDVLTDANGVNITVGTTVYSDNDGGTFDLDSYSNPDYFTFRNQRLGGVNRNMQFSMDNQNNDPADYLELTLTFDTAVTGMNFTLLDIDSGTWDDGVEVFYNGSNNARDNAGITVTTGAYNGIDNETYMHGWEGYGSNAGNNESLGNIGFDFGSIEIISIRIRYFSTDDADFNPGGQVAGLTDITYTEAVPEPSSVVLCAMFGLVFGWSQWRHLRGQHRPKAPEQQNGVSPIAVVSRASDAPVRTRAREERPLQNVA
ncbi:MAG: hypothetical protein KDA93_15105 [Planctomycetaceae bacterium]|nr:hypothetical protein [Planctomycetaceae bacterium]